MTVGIIPCFWTMYFPWVILNSCLLLQVKVPVAEVAAAAVVEGLVVAAGAAEEEGAGADTLGAGTGAREAAVAAGVAGAEGVSTGGPSQSLSSNLTTSSKFCLRECLCLCPCAVSMGRNGENVVWVKLFLGRKMQNETLGISGLLR